MFWRILFVKTRARGVFFFFLSHPVSGRPILLNIIEGDHKKRMCFNVGSGTVRAGPGRVGIKTNI